MKGDFSRSTFHREKHYSTVRMQQGRVQTDADWNEEGDIRRHVEETTAGDVLGPCGVPATGGGFRIGASSSKTDLTISPGRIYVDGILCENETILAYSAQAAHHLPQAPAIVDLLKKDTSEVGVVYLDVWRHHVTALEDDTIREVALGGPDTGTREQTLWQLKVLPLPGVNFPDPAPLAALLQQRATLSLGLKTAEDKNDGAEIAALQSQLDLLDGQLAVKLTGTNIDCGLQHKNWTDLVAGSAGQLTAQIHPGTTSSDPCELLPRTGFQRLENQLYRVEIHDGGDIGKATFKWSRENGSIVTRWLDQDNLNLTVAGTGRGAPLSFAPGDWVELIDDTLELNGRPGVFVRVTKAERDILTIEPPAAAVKRSDFPRNPRIRRWDHGGSTGAIKVTAPAENNGFITLEGNIEVKFSGKAFKTGDYWLIPARTAIAGTEIGDIEWPRDSGGHELAQPAAGIRHHFCRLAMVFLDTATNQLSVFTDCRPRFPPITELDVLSYVGGTGQSILPLQPLDQPLQVGVSNGTRPVAGAWVRFRVTAGTGSLTGGGQTFDTVTGADGIASCSWAPDATTQSQVVEARLIAPGNKPVHLPIRFSADLSAEPPQVTDFRISDIRLTGIGLRPGSYITPADLAGGIEIICTRPINAQSLNTSLNCSVTLLLPWPFNFADMQMIGAIPRAAWQAILLTGSVNIGRASNIIKWVPGSPDAQTLVKNVLVRLPQGVPAALPGYLTVKGNFILPSVAPLQPLDAEGFLLATGLQLPTGDARRGGDLEFHFVLVPTRPAYTPMPQVRLDALLPVFTGIGGHLV